MKVFLDPRCDIRYASFYIYGLYKVLGRKNVTFSYKYSKEVTFDEFNSVIDRILLCTFVENGKVVQKVAIDSRDPRSFLENAYKWCDIYAKTNYRASEDNGIHKDKKVLIPPSFGFKLWGSFMTIMYALYNTMLSLLSGNYGTKADLKSTFINYIWLILRRERIGKYILPPPEILTRKRNYAFFVASLWNYTECIEFTNRLRYGFANMLSLDPDVDFEGGFVINSLSAKIPQGWEHLCSNKRVSATEYIQKTQESFVVFNTPAVRECHGWKLPEFLSMGKAILSTPILNDLPSPLIDGIHFCEVHNEHEMRCKLNELKNDVKFRTSLQNSARQYWDEVACPEIVVKSILLNFKG